MIQLQWRLRAQAAQTAASPTLGPGWGEQRACSPSSLPLPKFGEESKYAAQKA